MKEKLLKQLQTILLACFTFSKQTKDKIKNNAPKLTEAQLQSLIEKLKELKQKEAKKIKNLDIPNKEAMKQNIQKKQMAFIRHEGELDHEKEASEADKILDELS